MMGNANHEPRTRLKSFPISSQAGILVGDLIVGVAGQDAKWAKHEEVVQLIRYDKWNNIPHYITMYPN